MNNKLFDKVVCNGILASLPFKRKLKTNMAEVKPKIETFAKIKVVGVGGAGNAILNRMMEAKVKGVEFIAVNTDAQALHHSGADQKIHIGQTITRGLGAGMDPQVGQQAAEESREEIHEILKGSDMVFVTGGMGGGTCSGASPIVAEIARESGALTIGFVTKPFSFEGQQRKIIAEESLAELSERVDASVVITNDRLLQVIDRKTSLLDAFRVVDDVLRQGVQGITDLITEHGIVNADFADVRTVMTDAGSALMGIGRATGENRAVEAARAAIDSPLLEVSIDGAKGILFNISGGNDLGMYEIEEVARIITENADPNARVKFGAVIDENQPNDEIRITVVATGFDTAKKESSGIKQVHSPMMKRPTPTFNRPQEQMHHAPAMPTVSRPAPVVPPQQSSQGSSSQEDLDIPTFIRKKMKT